MRYFYVLFVLILIGCKNDLYKPVIEANSVWEYAIYDINNPGKQKTVKLVFRDNGYAYETETILTYKWFYNPLTKTLTIANQTFDILLNKNNVIRLKHTKYGTLATLTKIR